MTHRDRAGDPSGQRAGRREAAGDAGHRQGFPTARPFARCRFACPTGTAVSQGFRAASRMAPDVPHRHATRVLAESLGKPSLWVIINAPWYKAIIAFRYTLAGGQAEAEGPGIHETSPAFFVPAPLGTRDFMRSNTLRCPEQIERQNVNEGSHVRTSFGFNRRTRHAGERVRRQRSPRRRSQR